MIGLSLIFISLFFWQRTICIFDVIGTDSHLSVTWCIPSVELLLLPATRISSFESSVSFDLFGLSGHSFCFWDLALLPQSLPICICCEAFWPHYQRTSFQEYTNLNLTNTSAVKFMVSSFACLASPPVCLSFGCLPSMCTSDRTKFCAVCETKRLIIVTAVDAGTWRVNAAFPYFSHCYATWLMNEIDRW